MRWFIHDSIASCAIEQKLGFLLPVLWEGPGGGTVGLFLVDCFVESSGVKESWDGSTLGGLPAKRADR